MPMKGGSRRSGGGQKGELGAVSGGGGGRTRTHDGRHSGLGRWRRNECCTRSNPIEPWIPAH
eukprot:7323105-Pyramimonas_sp.AAC.1